MRDAALGRVQADRGHRLREVGIAPQRLFRLEPELRRFLNFLYNHELQVPKG